MADSAKKQTGQNKISQKRFKRQTQTDYILYYTHVRWWVIGGNSQTQVTTVEGKGGSNEKKNSRKKPSNKTGSNNESNKDNHYD